MTIESIRQQINTIDKDLVRLITERMACSKKIGQLKSDRESPVRDRKREQEILAAVSAGSEDLELSLRIIYESIFAQSRQVQMDLVRGPDSYGEDVAKTRTSTPFPSTATVAYQNNDYAELAAHALFDKPEAMIFTNGEKIADAVDQGLCDFGILPIEDNRTGAYEATYQHLLRGQNVHIVRSVRLQLNYDLIAPEKLPLDKVRKVVGGYVSMVHCSKFLQKLWNVELVTVDRLIAEELEANPDDATAYMVPVKTPLPEGFIALRESIANRGDYLRYICLAPQAIIYPRADRTSLLLSTDDTPGSLAEVLARFAALNINLSLLESRPTKVGTDTFHRFFIDLESGIDDPMVQSILGQLHRDASIFRFLGSYEQLEVSM